MKQMGMPRRIVLALGVLGSAALFGATPQVRFDPTQQRWTLENGWIRASFQMTGDSLFQFVSIQDFHSGDIWVAPNSRPSSPVRFQVDGDWFDYTTPFQVI